MKGIYRRFIIYSLGLFMMSIGVAFSVKSDLGVSPVSAFPYSFSLITGIELGTSTIIIYCFFILLQMILLGKKFRLFLLLQIVCSVMFGYFTDLSLFLIHGLPMDVNYVFQWMYQLMSMVFVASGLFLYLPAKIISLPYEGILNALSLKTKMKLPALKIICDVTSVFVSASLCLIFIHDLGSVREGTIITAFGVGQVLSILMNRYSLKVRSFLYGGEGVLETKKNNLKRQYF